MTPLVALNRARAAWEATQPQLTLTGWADMLDGLDTPQPSALRCVEPAYAAHPPLRGGLQAGGTEPRHAPPEGADGFPRVAGVFSEAPSVPPHPSNGRGASHDEDARRGQEGG